MSSHHVVLERQEPALVVEDPEAITDEVLDQLLEWSPTVICNLKAYEILVSRTIKIDLLIVHEPLTGVQYQTAQLATAGEFITASLEYLTRSAYHAVNIVTNLTQSNNLSRDYLTYAASINMVFLTNNLRIFNIRPGYSKWKPAGEKIYLYLPEERIATHTEGLQHIAGNSYQTLDDGFYSLTFSGVTSIFIGEVFL